MILMLKWQMLSVIQLANSNSVLNLKTSPEFGKFFEELKDVLGAGKEGRILCHTILLPAPYSFLAWKLQIMAN